MIKVKVTTNFEDLPLHRQTPEGRGVWGKYKFFINEDIEECDYWVVFEGLNEEEETICRKKGKILFTGEPKDFKKYEKKFLEQFDYIVTSQREINHPGVIYDQQSIPWFVGWQHDFEKGEWLKDYSKSYDELKGIENVNKDKLASVIVSNKVTTSGHRKRLWFIKKLKKYLGKKIDLYGRGFNPVPDKWNAIAPYKYHICFENTATEDYWTEKISDAFLGLSYPIYWGCTNIDDYFPKDSFSYIDIRDSDKAVQQVEDLLDSGAYEKSLEDIKEAKRLILDTYNFFPHTKGIIENRVITEKEKVKYTVQPENKNRFGISRILGSSKVRMIYNKLINMK